MNRLGIFLAVTLLAGSVFFSQRGGSAGVPVRNTTVAFLIRFGQDAKENVDWSGSITTPGVRLTAWQFDDRDELKGSSWKCATRKQNYWDTPYERRMQPTSWRDKVTVKGLFVEPADSSVTQIHVDTTQGSFDVATNFAPGDAPREYLGGRVQVAAVPATTNLTPGENVEDFPSLTEARDGSLWVAYQTYKHGAGDQIYASRFANGEWSSPEALAEPGGGYYRTAIAQDLNGKMWVAWSARKGTNFDLYARAFDGRKWSAVVQLTSAENSDFNPAMVADSSGRLFLAYQSARAGNFDIYLRVYDGRQWSSEIQVSSDPANQWEPALAAAPDGRVTILWDTYAAGNYDVVARTWQSGKLGAQFPIADSPAFETRVSAQYDRQGRLWAAWDEGDFNWGKDYGYQIPESGRGILTRRQVRVAVLANGRLQETRSRIGDAVPEDLRQVFHHPTLVLDGNGNPWVFFRTRVNLPRAGGGEDEFFRALWRMEATTLRDGRWSPMIEFPQATGRIDLAMAAVRRKNGDLAAVWATDGRTWPTGSPRQQDLEFSLIAPGKPAQAPELIAFEAPAGALPPSHTSEAKDIERVRSYRAKLGDRTWRIARGDIHRHTDLSWDGNRDGSLDDSYRYALDAAGFDYLGVCDHQAGMSIPYNWWRLQKAVDLYTIRDRFTPLYSYERSLKWPNGHRNVLFSARGNPILDIGEPEASGQLNTGKVLFPYLKKYGGVSMPHTSGSGAGTDFRDNDPSVEPVVEIYQGYRSNFETLGAPRAPSRQESVKFTAGFVWSAWAKGLKLGVQASSDHVSTHISYAGFYVDRLDRDAIIESLKARRSYAATDNAFVDLRMGDHFMGESFRAQSPLPMSVYVSGTGEIARVEVIHNNKVVYVAPGSGSEMAFNWTDNESPAGENYYYVRVTQRNGQLIWSSPIWVEYR
ncbi:MAG TPA: hypothetical protein VGL72_05590 [Bryobacteraceae bacterium]|jgi:hypothetical protein